MGSDTPPPPAGWPGAAPTAGGSAADINAAADVLNVRWPEDYAAFVIVYGGAEGFAGENYFALTAPADLPRDAAAGDFLPHLIPFASNGGGEAYCFRTDRPDAQPWPVVLVPWIGGGLPEAVPIAESFTAFLNALPVWTWPGC